MNGVSELMLGWLAVALAAVPCALFCLNLGFYRRLPRATDTRAARAGQFEGSPAISVLIPARNEEANIRGALDAVLATPDLAFEVLVLDDHSTDHTAAIVAEYVRRDPRVRLATAPALPAGWCGKPHACHVLAGLAKSPVLVFVDADVRLTPDALPRMLEFLLRSGTSLASGVPRQIVGTLGERWLIPLIHSVLLGWLPMAGMRWTRWPAFSAGCGQLFVARRADYFACGGHAAIPTTLHDGLKLPRLFRQHGFHTDLFDATDVATCRMYAGTRATVQGLLKNATEGLAARHTIVPMTALLLGSQILPFALLASAHWLEPRTIGLALLASLLVLLPRVLGIVRFHQPISSALAHPLAMIWLLALQWIAFARSHAGQPSSWKGREYPTANPAPRAPAHAPLRGPRTATVSLLLLLLLLLLALRSVSNAAEPALRAPGRIELADQFGTLHRIEFPSPKAIVLTVADRKGADQVDAWVTGLRGYDTNFVSLHGLADLGAVPRFLQERVRRRFREERAHPVLLDWGGAIPNALECRSGQANIFVIDRQGFVRAAAAGPAAAESLERIRTALQTCLRTAAAALPKPVSPDNHSTSSTSQSSSVPPHP